jgi:hypothetical protein
MENKRIVGEFTVPFFGFVQHEGDEFTVEDLVALCGVKSSADLFRFVMDDELAPMFLSEHEASVRSVSAEVDPEADVYFEPSD